MKSIDSPRRVFILGAGASRDSEFKLPTMGEFFNDPRLSTEELKEFLCKYSGNNDPTSVNLEDVMSYLEISSSEFSFLGASDAEKKKINSIRNISSDLKQYIIRRLSHDNYPQGICKKHKALFDTLRSEDTVITLNYDMIADYALAKSEEDFQGIPNTRLNKLTYLVQEKTFFGGTPTSVGGLHGSPGYYLKLHGSINWVHCPNLRCRKHDYIAFHQFWMGEMDKSNPQPGLLCAHCGSPLEVLVIPPTFTKQIEAIPKLQLLWNLSRREISDATEIILIGVSLAPSDFLLRWLLKHATYPIRNDPARVIVVNPNEEHRERAKEVMAVKIYPYNTIEEYLNSSNKVLR